MAGSPQGRHEHAVRASERAYRSLLRAYPHGLRDEYGDEMALCFRDLCREELEDRGRRGLAALWAYTLPELIYTAFQERSKKLARNTYRYVLGVAIVTALLLLIPLLGNWPWTLGDFGFAGAMIFGTGLAFVLVARGGSRLAYRAAVGVSLAAAFLLVWINAAVGIIGAPDEAANLMYIGVLAVGIAGAFVARFRPQEMARALLATSLAQALVATITLFFGLGSGSPPGVVGVLILNGFFVSLFAGSALLFRYAGREQAPAGVPPGV
jgi:hypothetical protein